MLRKKWFPPAINSSTNISLFIIVSRSSVTERGNTLGEVRSRFECCWWEIKTGYGFTFHCIIIAWNDARPSSHHLGGSHLSLYNSHNVALFTQGYIELNCWSSFFHSLPHRHSPFTKSGFMFLRMLFHYLLIYCSNTAHLCGQESWAIISVSWSTVDVQREV